MKISIPVYVLMFLIAFYSCQKDDYEYRPHDGSNRYTDTSDDNTNDNPLAWTQAEIDSIISGANNSMMRVFIVDNYEDSIILRKPSIDVIPDQNDTILDKLIDRMYATVNDPNNPGVGIAAPQVGINRKIIWVERQDKTGSPFEVYLNPKIVQVSAVTNSQQEGCLSIPNPTISGNVERPWSIYLEYTTPDGTDTSEVIMHQYVSRIFQHEIDHLYGIFYTDHIDTSKNQKILDKLEQYTNYETGSF
ncbi:MAG: peptide deformylase [Marinilabiliales bacterium]|nr:MAG: peptide deformylase [Marinilabiliales bacterium]